VCGGGGGGAGGRKEEEETLAHWRRRGYRAGVGKEEELARAPETSKLQARQGKGIAQARRGLGPTRTRHGIRRARAGPARHPGRAWA
jgi:hypothetical protein